jgi:hypothetical protein
MLTRKLRVFLLAVIFCHPVWGQPDSLALPASITGTWQLTFEDAQSGSPITNGVSVDMTLNSNGAVCVADLLLIQPVVAQGNAVWRLPEMGLELHLHGLDGNTAPQAVLRSAGGDYLGRFKTIIPRYASSWAMYRRIWICFTSYSHWPNPSTPNYSPVVMNP